MTGLAWANIKHRKLRSCLAALAVAIGVAMLVTMLALSHGTLEEVAQRVKGIDADLIILPPKSSLIFSDGATLSDKYIDKIAAVQVGGKSVVRDVIPVNLAIMEQMAGQQQRVFAIDTSHFEAFSKGHPLVKGRLFDKDNQFKAYIARLEKNKSGCYQPDQVPDEVLNQACELIIDNRLARAGKYSIGDKVPFLGRDFSICGIIEAGAAGRVFAPSQVVRHISSQGMPWSTLYFVKLDPNVVATEDRESDQGKIPIQVCMEAVAKATRLKVASLREYDQMLFNSFRPIYVYINIASALILIVSFLFIMVTIYTMVLERRREIGILRSMGPRGHIS